MSRMKIKDGDLPPEFLTPEEARKLSAAKLSDIHKHSSVGQSNGGVRKKKPRVEKVHEGMEAQDSTHIGRYNKTSGYWKYRYNKAMTPRMKVLSSLLSFGMPQTEILKMQRLKPTAHNTSHICMAAKDDQIVERMEQNVDEMVEKAKDIIQRSAVKAAENFAEAVEEGDLKASGKVLEFCGAFKKQTDVNVNMTFGAWLKTTQNNRAMDAIDVTPSASERSEQSESGRHANAVSD